MHFMVSNYLLMVIKPYPEYKEVLDTCNKNVDIKYKLFQKRVVCIKFDMYVFIACLMLLLHHLFDHIISMGNSRCAGKT